MVQVGGQKVTVNVTIDLPTITLLTMCSKKMGSMSEKKKMALQISSIKSRNNLVSPSMIVDNLICFLITIMF